MKPSNNLENKTPSDTYWRAQLVCMKLQTHNFLEPQTDESRFVITFLTILGVMDILSSFRLVLKRKTGKEISKSSRLEFLEKLLASDCALSDADDNTSGPLNRGGRADLPLSRTLLAICQKSREPIFWEVMESFVLLAYASLAASRTLLQLLLACLNFTLDSEQSNSTFGLLIIKWHSATRTHLFPYPPSRWQVRSEKAKKRITINTTHPIRATTSDHLSKPILTDLTIKSDSVLTNPIGKGGVRGWSMQ